MDTWNKYKRTLTDLNELHNEEAMGGTFEGTGLTEFDIYQDPQDALKDKIGNFDEADLQKAYARSQGKYYKTVTIESRSRQIGRELKPQTTPGLNIALDEYPYIKSGLNQESTENEYASLLGGSSLALEPPGYDISLLSDEASMTGDDVYPPEVDSLGASTSTGHTIPSKVKQAP